MTYPQLQPARRGLCAAIAVGLLGPFAAAQAQPSTGAETAAALAGEPAPAQAQGRSEQAKSTSTQSEPTSLEVVVVTANKRSEGLQDVPMAVSALLADELDRASAQTFADYAARVPGLNVISQGPGQSQLVLRGITSGANTPNATVGTYIDDVPFGSSTVYSAGSVLTPDIDPDDVQHIEVLRGPQGTLYGANTLGGLVKFVTTPPDSTRVAGRVAVDAGSVSGGGHGNGVRGMLNLPIVQDTLALRVNAYSRKDPGYIDNVFTGQKDVNEANVRGGRAQLLWTPDPAFSLRLSALAQNLSGDALATGGVDIDPATLRPIHGDLTQSRAAGTGEFDVRYRLYDATANADFGWARLVSSTSYGSLDKLSNIDLTTAYGPLLNEALGLDNGGYSNRNPIALGKFTQELRLQSPEDQVLEWRAGLFYTREHTRNTQDILAFDARTGTPIMLPLTLGKISAGPSVFTEWAGYGDVTWHATSRFSLLLGARYTRDRTIYNQSGEGLLAPPESFTVKATDNPTTFLVNPSFKFSDNLLLYGRVASGFRPGGPNGGVPPELNAPTMFGPDKLTSYELGLKSSMLDNHMSIDVAAFYIDWSQIQLTSHAGGFSFLGNGGKASSRGIEASWRYAIAGLTLSANATWADAQLDADTTGGLYGFRGDRLPYVPKWSTHFGVDYDFPLGGNWSGYVGGDYHFVGARKTDFNMVPGPRFDVPSYSGVDLRAGVFYENWELKAYVKNVGNQRGISSMSSLGLEPLDPPYGAIYMPPRTVGLSLSVVF